MAKVQIANIYLAGGHRLPLDPESAESARTNMSGQPTVFQVRQANGAELSVQRSYVVAVEILYEGEGDKATIHSLGF